MIFSRRSSFMLWLVVIGVALGARFVVAAEPALTALDRYVHEDDPAYSYELRANQNIAGVTVHQLHMTSQTWLAPEEVEPTTWWHWLVVYQPETVRHDTALLVIGGGSNRDEQPPGPNSQLAHTAMLTGSVIAELRMVPNQPLVFHGDGHQRYEDDLIAYGWDQFLRGGRDEWLARLPMTKSAVRAMDTITDFFARPEQGSLQVDRYVVTGGSKRGWTTWTTAAVDERVVAIAPMVIDLLNMVPSFKHHWEAYGFYAPAIGDYERHGIMDWQDTPEYEEMARIVEPYEYRDRLTLPKLLINATGDQFFLPDSHRFYFDDLEGPTYVRYVPNTDHSLRESDAPETLAAWHYAIINDRPLPEFDWRIDWDQGEIEVKTEDTPAAVKLWQATNPTARDFRVETIGRIWTSEDLAADDDGVYRARVEKPNEGWTAFFVELTYEVEGSPAPIKLTSGVAVVPDVLPFSGQMPTNEPER